MSLAMSASEADQPLCGLECWWQHERSGVQCLTHQVLRAFSRYSDDHGYSEEQLLEGVLEDSADRTERARALAVIRQLLSERMLLRDRERRLWLSPLGSAFRLCFDESQEESREWLRWLEAGRPAVPGEDDTYLVNLITAECLYSDGTLTPEGHVLRYWLRKYLDGESLTVRRYSARSRRATTAEAETERQRRLVGGYLGSIYADPGSLSGLVVTCPHCTRETLCPVEPDLPAHVGVLVCPECQTYAEFYFAKES